jgi:hypothetical protein
VLQLKELGERDVGKKVTNRDAKILEVLEGLRGGGAWFAGHPPTPRATAGRRRNRADSTKPL